MEFTGMHKDFYFLPKRVYPSCRKEALSKLDGEAVGYIVATVPPNSPLQSKAQISATNYLCLFCGMVSSIVSPEELDRLKRIKEMHG